MWRDLGRNNKKEREKVGNVWNSIAFPGLCTILCSMNQNIPFVKYIRSECFPLAQHWWLLPSLNRLLCGQFSMKCYTLVGKKGENTSFFQIYELHKAFSISQISVLTLQIWYPQKDSPWITASCVLDLLFFSKIIRKIKEKYKLAISLTTSWLTTVFLFSSLT